MAGVLTMKITKLQLKQIIREEWEAEVAKDYRKEKYAEYAETFEMLDYPINPNESIRPLWDRLNDLLQAWRPESSEGIQYQKDLIDVMQGLQGIDHNYDRVEDTTEV